MTDDRLKIPATRALLEGWCGPVEATVAGRRWFEAVSFGVVAADGVGFPGRVPLDDVFIIATAGGIAYRAPADIRLDLSRTEVYDRVARVVAATVLGLPVGSGVAVQFVRNPLGGQMLTFAVTEGTYVTTAAIDSITSPALAALDPNDDTRLPDRSRLVDALALAAVAREVLRG